MAPRSSPSFPSARVAKARGRLARPFRAVRGAKDATSSLGRGQDRSACRRHARLDRDPAPLARARARAIRPPRSALLGQWRHHRLCPWRRERVNGIGVGFPPKFVGDAIGACVAGQIELPDARDLDRSMIIQEGVLPSALAPLLPVFFIAGGRLLGAAQSLIKGVYQGPLSQPAHLLRRLARRRERAHQARQWQRPDRMAGRRRAAGLCPRRRGPDQGGGGGRRALHQEPARRDHHGHQAGDRPPAWRLRHGSG